MHFRYCQLFCRLGFTGSVNNFGAPFAFRLRLFRQCPHHGFIEIYMLDLHIGHFDTPCNGLLVEYTLYIGIELLTLSQHVIQFMLSQNRAQGSLGKLAGCLQKVFHLDNCPFRIDNTKVDNRVHLHRHIIPGDHILGRYVHDNGTQINSHHLLQNGDNDYQARSFHFVESAKHKNNAAFILAQNAKHGNQ